MNIFELLQTIVGFLSLISIILLFWQIGSNLKWNELPQGRALRYRQHFLVCAYCYIFKQMDIKCMVIIIPRCYWFF